MKILKTMLEYKCENAGVLFEEVNEAYTTQTCSCCGSLNILALGHERLAVGIPLL